MPGTSPRSPASWACSRWLGVVAALLLAVPGWAQQRVALVIGNDSYEQISRLRNARADAQSMARALSDAGYHVDLKLDRTQREMLDDVRALRQRIRGGEEVVFFFSGHGVQIGPSNHLLPINVRNQSEEQVRDDALEVSRVLADLRGARPAFTLAIIDACRDNPFAGAGRSIGGRGLTGVAGANGQMVIYAAGEGQQALDRLGDRDPTPNGLFTRVFVREMKKPGVPVHQVLRNVRVEVARLAQTVGQIQVPAIYDQVLGDFFFSPPRTAAQGPLEASAAPEAATPARAQTPVAAAAAAPPAAAPAPVGGRAFRDCADCPEMVAIPAGRFLMGSPADEPRRSPDEGPQREVRLNGFALGRYEVTRGQWKAMMGRDPSSFGDCGDECPVTNVSWIDVQEYIRRLNQRTGQHYRLPSEAEWEYAARAGTTTPFHTGRTITSLLANFDGTDAYDGGPSSDFRKHPVKVGSFAANAFGLHDMAGNVSEWVQDCYDEKAYQGGAPNDGTAYDESRCVARVQRGGTWNSFAASVRSAYRLRASSTSSGHTGGFRLARPLS